MLGDSVVVPFVLFLECTEETMISRIRKRAGESQIVRSDDNMETLKHRFQTYKNETEPVIDYYEKMNKVLRIDANRAASVVTSEV